MLDIPKVLVSDAKEGDVIDISIDTSGTDARKKRIDKLMDDLWDWDLEKYERQNSKIVIGFYF